MKMTETARQRRNRKDEDGGEGLKASHTPIKAGRLQVDGEEENQKGEQAEVAGASRSSDSCPDEVEADHGTGQGVAQPEINQVELEENQMIKELKEESK